MPPRQKSADRRTSRPRPANPPPGEFPTLIEMGARHRRRQPRLAFGDPATRLAEAVAVARGAEIDRLDKMYSYGRLGWLLYRDSPDPAARAWGLALFQELLVALYPEEFGEPGPGLIPDSGGKRVGAARFIGQEEGRRRLAEKVTGRGGP